jgi:hypothetical protein
MRAKIATARFYAEHILARKAPGMRDAIVDRRRERHGAAARSVLTRHCRFTSSRC